MAGRRFRGSEVQLKCLYYCKYIVKTWWCHIPISLKVLSADVQCSSLVTWQILKLFWICYCCGHVTCGDAHVNQWRLC